jgi:WhiB family transcriptional regulator, redox-sensing transcriptional regulator
VTPGGPPAARRSTPHSLPGGPAPTARPLPPAGERLGPSPAARPLPPAGERLGRLRGGMLEELGLWAWRLEAACGGLPSSVFFSPEGERGAARRRRERAAKAICAGCGVREQCAEYALAHRERYGVWGGLSEHERAMIWDRQGGRTT